MGGETTEMSDDHHRRRDRGRPLGRRSSMFRTGKRHKLTSEAGKRNERGVDPTICEAAADRVAELLTTYGGGTVDPGVTVVGKPPAPRADRASPPTCPARVTGMRDRRATPTVAHLRGGRLRRSTGDGDALTVTAAALASRPHRPLRPRRGGRPDRRLRPGAVGAAARAGRPRADPRAAAAPPGRPHPGRRRLRRGGQLPVRRRRRPSTRSACRPTTCCGTPYGWPTRSRRRSRSTPRRCCPGCSRPPARNLGRGAAGVALFETGTVAFPVDRGPAPVYGVDWRPTEAELDKLFDGAARCSRCSWPSCSAASASPPAGGEPGRAGRLVRRRRGGPRASAAELGVEVEVEAGEPDAVAPEPVRAGARRRRRSSATPASCTRGSAPAFGAAAAAPPRSRSTSTP